jgi:hypothetical protein
MKKLMYLMSLVITHTFTFSNCGPTPCKSTGPAINHFENIELNYSKKIAQY